MNFKEKSKQIKSLALEIGFDACGIAKAEPLPQNTEALKSWLNKSYNSGMKYMENNISKRFDITRLVENAKSVIVVLSSYNPTEFPFQQKHLKMSRYTLVRDYHVVIKNKLLYLLKKINQNFGSTAGRAFVDSGPLFEKAWAQKAGLGWIGKNSLLINKEFGSFCFIGELVIDTELDYDSSVQMDCGTCNKCVENCPTHAIVNPRVINAGICIAYNTIENKDPIHENVKNKMNGWIYGCDICQEVCPWNYKSAKASKTEFISFDPLKKMTDIDWENLSRDDYNKLFKNSPVRRARFDRLKNNINAVLSQNSTK